MIDQVTIAFNLNDGKTVYARVSYFHALWIMAALKRVDDTLEMLGRPQNTNMRFVADRTA